jgi:TonB family protein
MHSRLLVAALVLCHAGPALAAIEQQNRPKAKAPEPPAAAPVLTKAPELIEFATAAYPTELLARGVGGDAVLLIDIDERGLVDAVQVVSATEPAFGDAAMTAATRFVFSPAEIDGKPGAIRIEYRYVFTPEAPVPDAVAGEVTPASQLPVNLAGVVKEAGTRRPVVGAVIELDGTAIAETDAGGRFEARGVGLGKHRLKASSRAHDAYETEAEVRPGERFEVTLYLVKRSGDPFETVVRTRNERQEVTRVQLDRQEVQKVPGTFGDPLRAIENLPGLARVPGGLGGALLVRGTPPADTAVFIDGVQIPLLYHFFGLTSVINPEFLDAIDFYPGGFGARFGRATGGAVEVKSRDVTCEDWHGVGEIGVLLSRGYLCAPAGDWSVAAAGRRSYIDLLLPFVLDRVQNNDPGQGSATVSPIFWDYQVKAEHRFGTHDIDIFAFGSDDSLKVITTGSAENVNFNLRLHTNFHRMQVRDRWKIGEHTTLTSSLTPGLERQGFSVGSDLGSATDFGVDIWSLEWREDLTHKVNDQLTLNAGLDHQFGWADIGITFPLSNSLRRFPAGTFDYTQTQSASYGASDKSQGYWVEAVFTPAAPLKIIGGLRLDYFDFESVGHLQAAPRGTVRYEVVPGTTIKGAYGLYYKLPQPQFLLRSPIGNPELQPERAHHFILGLEHKVTDFIDVSLEGYFNLRQNLRAFSDASVARGGKYVKQVYDNDGNGRTYGLELLLRHLATPDGMFYGWIAYTLSRSLVQDRAHAQLATPDAEGGGGFNGARAGGGVTDWYLSPFDQTHILTVVGQWTLPWGLEAGFRFRLTSGDPFTPLDRGAAYFDADAGAYRIDASMVKRSSDRLPLFQQLDVRVDKTFTFDLWRFAVYIEVLNAYNAHNVESYQYSYDFKTRVPLTLLPIVPTLGVRGEF